MQKFLNLIRYVQLFLANGLFRELLESVLGRFFGKVVYIDVSLDCKEYRTIGSSRWNLTARPIQESDFAILKSILSNTALPSPERREAVPRLAMLAAGIKTCYVVEDSDGNIRFLQWLVLPAENENLRASYGDQYPTLSASEGLMEFGYVIPTYRGTGVLAAAFGKIVDIASQAGVKSILGMISEQNVNSLASFLRLGFKPYRMRIEKRIFGIRNRTTVSPPWRMMSTGSRKSSPQQL